MSEGIFMRSYTVPEAARLAGVNVKTLRKHVKDGKLLAVETPVGLRISEDVLLLYAQALPGQDRPDRTRVDQSGGGPGWTRSDQAEPEETEEDQDEPGSGWTVGDQVGPDQTRVGQGGPEAFQGETRVFSQDQVLMKALDMLHLTNEEVRRLERESVAMKYELSSFQRALAESAESLTDREERLRVAAEAAKRAEELEAENRRLQELFDAENYQALAARRLAEENAKKLQEFELEKAALTERLKMSENRVDWLEKRVPRWVRSLFRAG
mgnify:CR=1 FL=1